ncbi:MAG: metallopeptidase family protein [Verrucomicrobia bacterium]|nr:metallopeptidase family protein [Verrucomicrobiota bacterium]
MRTDGHSLAQLPREELFAKAERTVQSTIERFPDELKGEAKKLPCLLKNWAEAKTSGSTLGHYIGFEIGRLSECNGPIILYLGAIQEYCTENGLDFEEEVRKTYLHEFGHHLGWDEGELEKRGLA